MIVRSWSGATKPGAAQAYLAFLEGSILPEIREVPGNLGARVLRGTAGDSDSFIVQTYWVDLESVAAFAGADIGVAVVSEEAQELLATYDRRAEHFDVVLDLGA